MGSGITAVSKKRPVAASEANIVKNKRTTSSKAVSKEKDLALISVAQDAVPIQVVAPISVVPAELLHVQKRKGPMRKLRMTTGSDDEIVEKESTVETVVVKQKGPTSVDDVDTIIEEVIAATAQLEIDVVEPYFAEGTALGIFLPDMEEDSVKYRDTDFQLIKSAIEKKIDPEPVEDVGQLPLDEDSLSIDDLLKRIPRDMMLPSVFAAEPAKIKFSNDISIPGVANGDCFKANLPKIALADKGKAPLDEPDTIKGHPDQASNLARVYKAMLFEGTFDRGFYIPRNHKTIFSTCWIRNLRFIEGSWLVEAGYDRWVSGCAAHVSQLWEQLPQRISVDFLAPISFFYEPIQYLQNTTSPTVKTSGWHLVCTEVLRYSMFGCLKLVGSLNLCTALVPVGPVLGDSSIPRRIVDYVSYCIQIVDSVCTDSVGQSPSTDSSMKFDTDDITLGTEIAVEQILLSATAAPTTDLSEQFAQLRASISQLSIKLLRTQSNIGNLQNHLLSRIDDLEKASANARTQQDQDLRGIRAQSGIFSTDLANIRKEVRDLSKEFDDKLATIRNDLLEFRVETQGQYATLSANLAELIAFVTKGRDDKKGVKMLAGNTTRKVSKKTVMKQNLSSREKQRFYQLQATVIQLQATVIQSQATLKLKENN
ncbi:hypothetical protein F511_34468 [Dorcoceras hygrometricum]|uniref:Uncharacterized protein n=1 Tax=Dorcoceras hygrometricum TaxID=472368 RepID=A0A2Z7CR48_9LAMI|nr:hypothetical protein F511_34468 [Dorcoceras hygrometricum]